MFVKYYFVDRLWQATLVAPLVTFSYMQQWLTVRIQTTLTVKESLCTVHSASYIEWEALSMVRHNLFWYKTIEILDNNANLLARSRWREKVSESIIRWKASGSPDLWSMNLMCYSVLLCGVLAPRFDFLLNKL